MELETKVLFSKGDEVEEKKGPKLNLQFSSNVASLLNKTEQFQELRGCKLRYDKIVNFKAKIQREEGENEKSKNNHEYTPKLRRVEF